LNYIRKKERKKDYFILFYFRNFFKDFKKEIQGRGQTEGKKLQQYSCIDNYGLLAALDSFVQCWVGH
jgi:hypothetical protein